jgi:S-adenosylmethionine:tRNA ribosyltransferase-isomerase
MLVARRSDGRLTHARFRDLAALLTAGDVLVINTSATLPAALPARRADGTTLDVHFSTPVPDRGSNSWVIELRRDGGRVRNGREGEVLALPAGGGLKLLAPYLPAARLWIAELTLPAAVLEYLARHGRPIRYRHMRAERPLADYQTVYATEPGSAEMPSAGRPFSTELITALVARGVIIAPLVLHAGVSSLEASEPPYPERFRVPASTARLVSAAREWGGRVIAVGTTSVRALETVALPDGSIRAGEGWTRVVVTPDRGVQAVDGLLTGWHEPAASHLLMLEAVAGRELVRRSYHAALVHGYLWHEFGDAHLILP